jgi:hypothetical protein
MASRKVADAHVQFSAEGIPALTRAVKDVEKNLFRLSATTGRGGLFGNDFAKDLANLDKVARSLRNNIQLRNQLMATQTQASLAADRTLASRAAMDRSRQRVASQQRGATMASPSLQAAQRKSASLDFQEIIKQRSELKRFMGAKGSPLSDKFKSLAGNVGNQVFDENPAALRKSAGEIRKTLNSISKFGPKGTGTKVAVDEVKKRMEAMAKSAEALANRMEELDRVIKEGASLSPEQRGRIRGNIRDELKSGDRVDAITRRQAEREERSVGAAGLLRRRRKEILSTPDITDAQKSNELGIAAREVASTLRDVAQGVREAQIDKALARAANKLEAGMITPQAFQSEIAGAEAKRRGVRSAGDIIEDANFRSSSGGASKDTVAMRQEAKTLKETKDNIDKLISSNSRLTEEEKKRLQVESELLGKEIKSSESRAHISGQMDEIETAIKGAMSTEREYQEKLEKTGSLSKEDTKNRKANKKEIDKLGRSHQELTEKMGGFNNDMHAAAGSSRRFNFMIQQASFGVQDFVQVIGQTGLSGALRASANNMASVAAATGKLGGALTGALGTVAMIGFAQVLEGMGDGAETAEDKLDRLIKKINKFSELRAAGRGFASDVAEQALGKGDFSVGLGAKARDEGSKAIDESNAILREIDTSAQEIADESKEANTRSISKTKEGLAALKLSGGSKDELEKIKKSAVTKFRNSLNREGGFAFSENTGKLVQDYEDSLDKIVKANLNDAESLAELALILDPSNKKIKEDLVRYTDSIKVLEVSANKSKALFDKMNESLGVFERDASERAKFSDSAMPDAADQIASRLSESASRLRRLTSDFESVGSFEQTEEELSPEAKLRKELVEQEKKVFDRYLQSLETINSQIDAAASPSSGIAKSIGDLISVFASSRADLKASLESAPASERERILAQSDKAKSRDLSAAVKNAVSGFSGEVEKTLGETQSQANNRMRADLFGFIKAIRASESTADDILIPAIQSAIEKVGRTGDSSLAVSSIEGLHQRIQESLVSDPAIKLQNEGNEILKRIEANTRPAKGNEADLLKGQSKEVVNRMRKIKDARGRFVEPDASLFSVPPPQFDPAISPSGHRPSDQTENSTERSNNLRRIFQGNQQARAGRGVFTGQSTEGSMSAAERSVRRGGYSDLLDRGGQNNESFFGARRGGTVGAFSQRRGVVDEASGFGGRRGSRLTASQRETLRSPAEEFAPRVIPAGPAITRDNVREQIDLLPPGFKEKAGPEMNSRTVKTAIRRAGIPQHFASAGRAEESGVGRFKIDEVSREAAGAGIPLSVPDAGPSRRGLRSQMRRDRITSGAAREERAFKDEKDKAERYSKRFKDKAEAAYRSIANKAEREAGVTGGALRSRRRRKAEGRDPSFMEMYEAVEFDKDKAEQISSPELESNVNTDSSRQTADATDEALQYHKNTSEKMNQLVELIKTRSESGGLVIS